MDGIALRRSASAPILDWPLSYDEKKQCALRLFDQDVQTANEVIRSNEEKLNALQSELEETRSAAWALLTGSGKEDTIWEAKMTPRGGAAGSTKAAPADATASKLRAAIASAAAALEALELEACAAEDEPRIENPRVTLRARSEGPVVGILRKDSRRRSRGPSEGGQRRVSFGNSSKEEGKITSLERKSEDCFQELESQPYSYDLEPEPELSAPEIGSQKQKENPQVELCVQTWLKGQTPAAAEPADTNASATAPCEPTSCEITTPDLQQTRTRPAPDPRQKHSSTTPEVHQTYARPARPAPCQIIIADDEPICRMAMTTNLTLLGVSDDLVTEADTAEETLLALRDAQDGNASVPLLLFLGTLAWIAPISKLDIERKPFIVSTSVDADRMQDSSCHATLRRQRSKADVQVVLKQCCGWWRRQVGEA